MAVPKAFNRNTILNYGVYGAVLFLYTYKKEKSL